MGVSLKENMHLVKKQVDERMAETELFLAELEEHCGETALLVRGEIELSLTAYYLRAKIVEGLHRFGGSDHDSVVSFTSDPCFHDADARILKGAD